MSAFVSQKFKCFDKNSAEKIHFKKDKEIKVSSLMEIRVNTCIFKTLICNWSCAIHVWPLLVTLWRKLGCKLGFQKMCLELSCSRKQQKSPSQEIGLGNRGHMKIMNDTAWYREIVPRGGHPFGLIKHMIERVYQVFLPFEPQNVCIFGICINPKGCPPLTFHQPKFLKGCPPLIFHQPKFSEGCPPLTFHQSKFFRGVPTSHFSSTQIF